MGGVLELTNEALFHQALARGLLPDPLARCVPRLVLQCEGGSLLVFEYWSGRTSLAAILVSGRRPPASTMEAIGTTIAVCHGCGAHAVREFLKEARNPIVELTRVSPTEMAHGPPALWDFVRLLQSEPMIDRTLTNIRSAWCPHALTHGDLKIDNLLVSERLSDGVAIIDWELAAIGDLRWDCAALIGSIFLAGLEHSLDNGVGSSRSAMACAREFLAAYDAVSAGSPLDQSVFEWAGAWILNQLVSGLGSQRYLTRYHLAALHLACSLLTDRPPPTEPL